jgi:hypothetical protein
MFDHHERAYEPVGGSVAVVDEAEELAAAADQMGALGCSVHLEFLRLIARLDEAGVWRTDGQTSMVAWVGLRHAMAPGTARDTVGVARRLGDLPALAAAYGDGRLSWDQLVPLCQLATADTDAAWATDGPLVAPTDLRRMVRSAQLRDDAAKEIHDQRGITVKPHRSGGSQATIVGEVTDIERLLTVLDRERERTAVPDPETGVYDPVRQQRYDALVGICRRELAADDDVDRATIVIHADVDVLTGENPDGHATTTGGTPVAAETVRRHCCDGRLEWAIDSPDGTTLGIGRAARVWPAWLSRLIRGRDLHCRFDGCHRPIHEIHHIAEWVADHGPTDDRNGIGLCWTHHRAVHEGGWTITGNPNGEVTFTSPHGRTLHTTPRHLDPRLKRRLQGITPHLFPTDE